MDTRTARCCCGDLSITVSGEPERVIACQCDYCQRRTGTISQVSCWYFGEQVESRTGQGQIYRGPDNPGIDYTFCPNCGSTVYWAFSVLENLVHVSIYGIAVGCFADANFPKPDLELWASKRHHWIGEVPGAESHPEVAPPERMLPKRS